MKKNFLLGLSLLVTAVLSFSSCSSDDNDDDNNGGNGGNTKNINGAFILNQGGWGANNASLSFSDLNASELSAEDVFKKQNNIDLGDLAQDMIIYGSKIYISVYGSKVIYVTDKNGKILKSITDTNSKDGLQPRHFDSYNGKVYVSLYDGYLARIDTAAMAIDKTIKVGLNPEDVKVYNSNIYVANSGGMNSANGYDKTVSVIDPELTAAKTLEVVINPSSFEVDKNNNLYLISKGNYGTIPNALQKFNKETTKFEVIKDIKASSMYAYGNKLYLSNSVWNGSVSQTSFSYYDLTTNKYVDQSFITDGTKIENGNGLIINPKNEDFYILTYGVDGVGKVNVFNKEGKKQTEYPSGSYFPIKVVFTTK